MPLLRDYIAEHERAINFGGDAVRAIEKRLAIPAACDASSLLLPAEPSFTLDGQAQMDILVRALACDLTRVATLQWSASTSNVVFSWLGIDEPHHTLSHYSPTDAPAQAKLLNINRWYAQMFANLLPAMKAKDVKVAEVFAKVA